MSINLLTCVIKHVVHQIKRSTVNSLSMAYMEYWPYGTLCTKNTGHLSFSIWLISLSIVPSISSMILLICVTQKKSDKQRRKITREVKLHKNKHRYREQIHGYQRKRVKWVKMINCMVIDGNSIFGGEHVLGYTEV